MFKSHPAPLGSSLGSGVVWLDNYIAFKSTSNTHYPQKISWIKKTQKYKVPHLQECPGYGEPSLLKLGVIVHIVSTDKVHQLIRDMVLIEKCA